MSSSSFINVTPESASGGSIGNTIMSDSVGVLWRAFSGTVDPWTKATIEDNAAAARAQASGGNVTPAQAKQQTDKEVTDYMIQNNGDPSQFWQGFQTNFIDKLKDIFSNVETAVLLLGGVAIAVLIAWHIAKS